MSLVIPAGYVNWQFVHSLSGLTREAVISIASTDGGGVTSSDLEGVATAWDASLMDVIMNTVTHTLTRVVGPDGTLFERSGSHAGLGTSAAMPPNVNYLLRKTTATPGRRGRGRTYLPGVREDTTDAGGLLTGTTQSDITAQAAEFLSAMATLGFGCVVLHDTVGITPSGIVTWECQPRVATQRRRLRK